LVIIAALLSAQAQDVVESAQHTQWGTLRYQVRPGQYTVIGELIEGGGVVGIPQVDNPNPQVDAEQVRRSTVRYTPSRDRGRPPEGATGEPLILYDPDRPGEPLAYFNNEQEARYYLSDRYFNELRRQGHLREGSNGGLPHYPQCTSVDCQFIAWTAEGFKMEDQRIAERALRNFVDTVREVARAIADVVQSIVQAVVDFFAGVFGWVRSEVNQITGNTNSGSGGQNSTPSTSDSPSSTPSTSSPPSSTPSTSYSPSSPPSSSPSSPPSISNSPSSTPSNSGPPSTQASLTEY